MVVRDTREIRSLDLSVIRHRGPDANGQKRVGAASLGHTRLSIIDLGGGSQPMTDLEDTATIVFNGEIYNFRELRVELVEHGCRFATSSDTEVILAVYRTWGIEGFARLRGMFAFAINDHRNGSTIIVRDPLGIKPLFYQEGQGALYFASELGALVGMSGDSPDLDLASVLETLIYRYPIGAHTVYRGIARLEPGVALVVPAGGASVRRIRFASIVSAVEMCRTTGVGSSLAEVEAQIADTIEHHAIADVPVGCFLSGGLDSSVVAQSLATRMAGRLQAYSVSFAGARSEQSELPYARAVADMIGADLHEVEVTAADFAAMAPRLSGTPNGPFSDPADIAMLKLSLTASLDVKVVLTGEGSDEAFAGYPKYAAERLAGPMRPLLGQIGSLLGRRGRIGIALDALSQPNQARRWMRWFENDAAPSSILSALVRDGADATRAPNWVGERVSSYPAEWSDMQRMQVLDLESWLPNNLLHRGDYTTMQASLEQRVPFLDMKMTPWAVALPDAAKVQLMTGKVALRRAFGGKLPPQVLKRRKSGFRLPLGEWLSTDRGLRAMAADHLLAPQGHLRGLIGQAALDRLLSQEALSTTGGAKLAWTALCLELWLSSLVGLKSPKSIHNGMSVF